MNDMMILKLDAEEISDTDADFHTLSIIVDEPMVRMLERYEAFNREEEVSIVKVIPGHLDEEPQHINLETLANGGFAASTTKHIKKLWPVTIQSSADIDIDQVITAYYVAHRLDLSVAYVPRGSGKVFIFGASRLTDEMRDDLADHMHDPDDSDLFFEARADQVIRGKKKG